MIASKFQMWVWNSSHKISTNKINVYLVFVNVLKFILSFIQLLDQMIFSMWKTICSKTMTKILLFPFQLFEHKFLTFWKEMILIEPMMMSIILMILLMTTMLDNLCSGSWHVFQWKFRLVFKIHYIFEYDEYHDVAQMILIRALLGRMNGCWYD